MEDRFGRAVKFQAGDKRVAVLPKHKDSCRKYVGGIYVGRSIEFRMMENEEDGFLEFLKASGISVISATSKMCCPDVIDKLHRRGENIFWNKVYLAGAGDVDRIKMAYVKSCNHYIIEDTFEAPVIEFRRSRDNKLHHARVYAEFFYYVDGEKKFKGEEFQNLYKNIETWIKNNYSIIKLN
jgi:hypothetical protein